MSAGTERAEGERLEQEERARRETDLQGRKSQSDISRGPSALTGRKMLAVEMSMNLTVV